MEPTKPPRTNSQLSHTPSPCPHLFHAHTHTQLDALARQVEGLPRSEAAARRIGVGKLLKDFERVRALAQLQLNEVSLIKVASAAGDAAGGTGSVFRMGGAGGGGMGGMATSGRGGDFNPGEGESAPSPPSSSAAAPRLMQTLQGQDVDEMIMEERERDIRKMNQVGPLHT